MYSRADLLSVSFSDDLHGSITDANGMVWLTGDGGMTWLPFNVRTNPKLVGIYMSDRFTGWAVGENGLIVRHHVYEDSLAVARAGFLVPYQWVGSPDTVLVVGSGAAGLTAAINLAEIPFSFWTIVLGHATFCVVVVYNNAVARLRRASGSLIEASMDLGADGFQTFRLVILPNLATALLAGGMLAFALSFDEVIVTTFTAGQQSTLPIWMLTELVRPRQRPVTNVVAVFVIAATFLPILAAYYLTREGQHTGGEGK